MIQALKKIELLRMGRAHENPATGRRLEGCSVRLLKPEKNAPDGASVRDACPPSRRAQVRDGREGRQNRKWTRRPVNRKSTAPSAGSS
jgi:hypothetical protein